MEDLHKHHEGIRVSHIKSNDWSKRFKILIEEGYFDFLAITEAHLSANVTNDELMVRNIKKRTEIIPRHLGKEWLSISKKI